MTSKKLKIIYYVLILYGGVGVISLIFYFPSFVYNQDDVPGKIISVIYTFIVIFVPLSIGIILFFKSKTTRPRDYQ